MKRIASIIPLLALLVVIAVPLAVHAAGGRAKSEIVMKMGSKVHLFHSGGTAARNEIAVGEVLPVYRYTVKPEQKKEVGQVKVLGFVNEHYFEAQVVKGDIKVGDIAEKQKTGMLVQPAR